MLLKDALEISAQSQGKVHLVETLGIKIKEDHFKEKFYLDKINSLPKGRYFLSDLDGTFFRGFLIKEVFAVFIKYFKDLDVDKISLNVYKEFIEDYKLFREMEKQAINRQMDYLKYVSAGFFIVLKYSKYVGWNEFLLHLREYFYMHQKVSPFRFSLNKLKETLENDINFMFISGSSNFVFDIYLGLLKDYITELFGLKAADKVYGFSSYTNLDEKYIYNLSSEDNKFNFIARLKQCGILEEIVGGMGDTESDYGIANNLDKGKKFYFVNPTYGVIKNYKLKGKEDVDFVFVNESKDLIFQYNLEDIVVLS